MARTVPAAPRRVLIILDGLGDRPHPATGGRSPVEAARTPHLDALAARGRLGRVRLLGEGVAPESDAGVLALLGYDPERESPGRGVLEAVGLGVPLAPGDVAFRMNFATADAEGVVVDSRVGRSLATDEAAELGRAVTAADLLGDLGIAAELRPSVGHRGVLWLHPRRGGPLSPAVSNADPFYARVGGRGEARKVERPRVLAVEPLDASDAARRTARATDAFLDRARPILASAPVNLRRAAEGRPVANTLLLRHAGAVGDGGLVRFADRHGLAGGAAVTEMPVERGIAQLLGLEDEFVGPMSPPIDAALRERARRTRAALDHAPFVYVHLKGPDEPGHDGRADAKRAIVEELDRSFVGPFLDGLDLGSVRIAVTADHATPCILKAHSDDPVPLLLAGAGVTAEPRATPPKFGETDAAAGSLGTILGRELLPLLLRPGPIDGA